MPSINQEKQKEEQRIAIKVNWFIPVDHRDYNRMPASVWIRCLQLLPYLEQQGIVSTLNEPEAEADIAIFVRRHDDGACQLARQQKARGSKIIVDLCVNYFDETTLLASGQRVTGNLVEETKRMVNVCDVVVCASHNIAQRARDFHPWVEYVPDSIDRRHFIHTKSPEEFERPKIRAIWSGIASKACELEPILPLLKKKKIDLILITDQAPRLKHPGWIWKRAFPYQFLPWSYETFPKQMLKGELCISYRSVDNTYNQGHSLFKIGVFMAQGIPAVASPVPSYIEAIEATQGGQICYSLADWKELFELIRDDRQILKTWSMLAYQAMEKYSTDVVAQRYVDLFQRICA